MDEDLFDRFLPQFLELARVRIEQSIAAVTKRDPAAVFKSIRELHTIAGEAGLLGLKNVVPLARDSEKQASRMHVSRTDADADAFLASLHELRSLIESMRSERGVHSD